MNKDLGPKAIAVDADKALEAALRDAIIVGRQAEHSLAAERVANRKAQMQLCVKGSNQP